MYRWLTLTFLHQKAFLEYRDIHHKQQHNIITDLFEASSYAVIFAHIWYTDPTTGHISQIYTMGDWNLRLCDGTGQSVYTKEISS